MTLQDPEKDHDMFHEMFHDMFDHDIDMFATFHADGTKVPQCWRTVAGKGRLWSSSPWFGEKAGDRREMASTRYKVVP